MRQILIIITVVLGLAVRAPAQQTDFPYTAIVLESGAKVHSGPGDSHYATHELKENELVEVYRHDPGGWCAIRPPAKSFSLIPETAVKKLGPGVAEVLADGSQAWVGTALGPVDKPLWQVKLKKGERVAIVGKASWPHPSGKSIVWLQIEPPAGEYRWVRLADLQLPPDEKASPKLDFSEPPKFSGKPKEAKPSIKPGELPSTPTPKTTFNDKEFSSKSNSSPNRASSGWKAATRPIPKSDPPATHYSGTFRRPDPIASEIASSPRDSYVDQATFIDEEPSDPRFERWDGSALPPVEKSFDPADKFTSSPERFSPSPERFASLDSFERQTKSLVREREVPPVASAPSGNVGENSILMDIEEQLSNEILKEPQSWNLAELKFQAERAKARSGDPVERMALQHVLEKIARCDELRKGYQQASPFSAAAPSPTPVASLNQTYDAMGWLKKTASSSGSVDPVYVLQDSLGNVTHEIAGSTGMNLGPYLDKQVGVIGRRGFNRRLKLNHVTVDRVVVLR